jgi:hypothetical protein
MMNSSHFASRMKIIQDPDCRNIFIEEKMLIPCSSACGELVWFKDAQQCNRCTSKLRPTRKRKATDNN